MKTGTLQVLGQERLNRRSPVFLLGVWIGAYAIFFLFVLALIVAIPNWYPPDWVGFFLLIGLPIACIGAGIIKIYPARFARIRLFDITYVDNTEDGGEFEIKYRDVRAEKEERRTMIVERITNNPKQELIASWSVQLPKSFPMDTKIVSTVDIISKKGSRNLRLAFSSVEEMNKSLPQFGSNAKRIVTN
jgi:hypothetical protein